MVDLIRDRRGRAPADLRGRPGDGTGAVGPLRRAHLHAVHLRAAGRSGDAEAYTEAIEDARLAAERDFGIVLRWIYDIPGEAGPPGGRRDARATPCDHAPDGLVGFGLGGPEVGVPRPQFRPHFDAARAAGLRSVPHAGETTGPQTVWDALQLLGAERIGHGTSAAQDPALLDHLAATGIPLEVCPSSNVATRAVASPGRAPAARVRRRGRRGHRQQRRPADVRHQPEPGVRDRGRTARPRPDRPGRPGPRRPWPPRSSTRPASSAWRGRSTPTSPPTSPLTAERPREASGPADSYSAGPVPFHAIAVPNPCRTRAGRGPAHGCDAGHGRAGRTTCSARWAGACRQ